MEQIPCLSVALSNLTVHAVFCSYCWLIPDLKNRLLKNMLKCLCASFIADSCTELKPHSCNAHLIIANCVGTAKACTSPHSTFYRFKGHRCGHVFRSEGLRCLGPCGTHLQVLPGSAWPLGGAGGQGRAGRRRCGLLNNTLVCMRAPLRVACLATGTPDAW